MVYLAWLWWANIRGINPTVVTQALAGTGFSPIMRAFDSGLLFRRLTSSITVVTLVLPMRAAYWSL